MRVVIDLTEFNTWSGHLTGVQRVVHGFAAALGDEVDSELETVFVGFDARQKVFHQVSYEHFRALTTSTAQESGGAAQAVSASLSTKQQLKSVAKKIYYKAPMRIQNKFTPERKERLKNIAKRTLAQARAIKTQRRNQILLGGSSEEFTFKKGDIVLLAGRAWDNNNCMSVLEDVKTSRGVKLAYVVYDLIPIYQQHTFGPGLTERYSQYLFRILRNADYLFPISDSSHRDLLRYADEVGITRLPVIKTVRLGDDIPGDEAANPPAFIKNPVSFTMTVGTIEARKNHMEIYYAYKLAAEKGIDLPDMYIIGKPGWLTGDVIYFIQHDLEVKDKITIIHNVSDEELAWMYRHALFTVYPSQYEGWGLPIAESLALGTPCIASNTSSMVEIAPEYVDHVSPFDTGELMDKMAHYSKPKNSESKRRVIESGYKLHSWKASVGILRKTFGLSH